MARTTPWRGVLFDLDGTLLDTAPDLVRACNVAAAEWGLREQSTDLLRPFISYGAEAMLTRILEANGNIAEPLGLMDRILALYEENVAVQTRFFDGMEAVVDELEHRGLPWGIVTNKLSRYTDPLLLSLGLLERPGCVISGDTLPEKKPHPLPMLEACRRIGNVPPQDCVYIGDARRDILAGKNAGMATLAAVYGYVPNDDPAHTWGADGLLEKPLDLLSWLDGEWH